MTMIAPRREAAFTDTHPEMLRGDALDGYSYTLTRVDTDTVAPIRTGEPSLGWEGDSRLQMYWDGSISRYVLLRLEHDGAYRPVCASPAHSLLNTEFVNRLISRLVATDVRRGFDIKASVDAHNARIDATLDRQQGESFEAKADKLRWALKRDKADYYC